MTNIHKVKPWRYMMSLQQRQQQRDSTSSVRPSVCPSLRRRSSFRPTLFTFMSKAARCQHIIWQPGVSRQVIHGERVCVIDSDGLTPTCFVGCRLSSSCSVFVFAETQSFVATRLLFFLAASYSLPTAVQLTDVIGNAGHQSNQTPRKCIWG